MVPIDTYKPENIASAINYGAEIAQFRPSKLKFGERSTSRALKSSSGECGGILSQEWCLTQLLTRTFAIPTILPDSAA
jgi:hypothetical protein